MLLKDVNFFISTKLFLENLIEKYPIIPKWAGACY
jgi:hypothetical protein